MVNEELESSVRSELNLESWFDESLTIIVFGASGDLAKKKTYPALFDLYLKNILPRQTLIAGYARSDKTPEQFRSTIEPHLLSKNTSDITNFSNILDNFFSLCLYRSGQYDKNAVLSDFSKQLHSRHKQLYSSSFSSSSSSSSVLKENRVFYFALPPNVFLSTAIAVRQSMTGKSDENETVCDMNLGFTRVVIEKPFGTDTCSAKELISSLKECFNEDELYRIDHYLGKELVQNMIILRFANTVTEPIWNREHIKSVTITFKEDIGVEGRGGYFEQAGIIRDIMQNHLFQVLSLIGMEAPVKVKGEGSSNFIRDEKVKLLKCVQPWKPENVVLGQYKGYRDDPTVSPTSNRETYCCVVMFVHNRRWDGVPFILKAGKCLDERKAEVRIQLRHPPGSFDLFNREFKLPNQELVIRLQPKEAIYLKTNLKKPGLNTQLIQSELDLTYTSRYQAIDNPDAYTRLILDVLRGKQSTFVRGDEVVAAWDIVTPLLNHIEGKDNELKLIEYERGSRGPKEADDLVREFGYEYNPEYSLGWKNRAASA